MNWETFHSESEQLAIRAHLATLTGDVLNAQNLYKAAGEAERRALDSVDKAKTRTRGITAVSAVALLFKAEEYALAEQVAYAMLADEGIPSFARDDLRNLVQAIWTEGAKAKAGVEFVPGQVTVSVRGGEVVTGGAPLDLIVDKVQTIQAMFYRTIELLSGVAHRRVGRPSKELQDSCRPWLFQAPPGSYQFSVAIQKPSQPDFFRAEIEPERIAEQFLNIVSASTAGTTEELERLVPDESYRNTFLKLSRNLAPTGKSFDVIELRASGENRPIALGVDSRAAINQNLRKKITLKDLDPETTEELRGTLRAVHLDKDWIDVVVEGESLHIEGLEDAVDDVIGPMINRSVVVRVVRSNKKKLKYVDIELAD